MNHKKTPQEIYNNTFKTVKQRKSNTIGRRLISRIVGAKNLNLLPIVYADNNIQEYKYNNNKIGYKDLPIYPEPTKEDTQANDQFNELCCVKESLGLHNSLMPIVSRYRKQFQSAYNSSIQFTTQMRRDICHGMCKMKCQMKCYFQNDDRLAFRQFLVVLGTVVGFALGSPKRGLLYRRVCCACVGNLTMGALCFPKETDENLRHISFELAKIFVVAFNWWFDQNVCIQRDHICCQCIQKPCLPTKKEEDLCEKILMERQKIKEKQRKIEEEITKNETEQKDEIEKEESLKKDEKQESSCVEKKN